MKNFNIFVNAAAVASADADAGANADAGGCAAALPVLRTGELKRECNVLCGQLPVWF